MGKIQENDARLQQLVSMARIGWWEVDFDEGVYYCSEFVADLLGIEGNKISAKDFTNLICENYRERILGKHSASCVFFSPLFLPTFVASL